MSNVETKGIGLVGWAKENVHFFGVFDVVKAFDPMEERMECFPNLLKSHVVDVAVPE